MDDRQGITLVQALALGVMACNYVADENPDLREWAWAACLLRKLLAEARGQPVAGWFTSVGSTGHRGGKA